MANDVDVNALSVSYKDYSNETSTFAINVQSLLDGATYSAARVALLNAIAGITDGNRTTVVNSLRQFQSSSPSSDTESDREKKILVRYEDDTTGKLYTVSIPCRDESAVTRLLNSDFLDITATLEAAFVTAFEALAESPAGNTVTVISMECVGRNL